MPLRHFSSFHFLVHPYGWARVHSPNRHMKLAGPLWPGFFCLIMLQDCQKHFLKNGRYTNIFFLLYEIRHQIQESQKTSKGQIWPKLCRKSVKSDLDKSANGKTYSPVGVGFVSEKDFLKTGRYINIFRIPPYIRRAFFQFWNDSRKRKHPVC